MNSLINPTFVPVVNDVKLVRFKTPVGEYALVSALGTVPSSGWSDARLSPVYAIEPPSDGIWNIDFVADPPSGSVLPIDLPVSAVIAEGVPSWMKGIRVRGSHNEVVVTEALVKSASKSESDYATTTHNELLNEYSKRAIFTKEIAVYDDSHQPIGFCSGWPPKVKMKKLRHRLILTVEGPDEGKIRRCVNEAIGAGLIAAIVAAFITGGAALSAAISAFKSYLITCLGSGFQVRVDRRSHWIEWCT